MLSIGGDVVLIDFDLDLGFLIVIITFVDGFTVIIGNVAIIKIVISI